MIKIIKAGTRNKKECENCGCIFSYDEEDNVMLGTSLYIECPQCGKEIILQARREVTTNEISIN